MRFLFFAGMVLLSWGMNSHDSNTLPSLHAPNTLEGLVGHFTFEKGAHDEIGNFGIMDFKGATISDGALQLDRGTWAQVPYHGPPLFEKTMVSFVRLKDLDLKGGSVITFTTNNSSYLNGLVFGDIDDVSLHSVNNYWTNTSEGWYRTQPLRPGYQEVSSHSLLKMAVSYKNVNGKCQISMYRNGEFIGQYTKGKLGILPPHESKVLFGMRQMHDKTRTYPPSYQAWLKAAIEEVQIYDRVLSQAEIRSLDFIK